MPIKSAILWDSHILGKKHKENLAALRAKSAKCQAVTEEQQSAKEKTISSHHSKSSCVQTVLKRANEDKVITGECVPEKKFKGDSNGQKNSVKEREEEDEEEEEEEDENRKRSNMGEEISGLPSDFFDTPRKTEDIMQSKKFNNDDSTEGIPEGFFDDPKLDAKARKVEYKDATEEEWEKFQKAMQVESQVSQSIVDEEDEESRVDREFTELSEQRLYFLRADALRDKQNVVKERILSQKEAQRGQTQKESPATNSDEDSDYEELFDWRAKKVFGHSQ